MRLARVVASPLTRRAPSAPRCDLYRSTRTPILRICISPFTVASDENSDAFDRASSASVAQSETPPLKLRHKVISLLDAAEIVSDGDTVCASGFVAQGAPEALLEGLAQRYKQTGSPHSLTLFFGGGPGDWGTKGLNHLAQLPEDCTEELKEQVRRAALSVAIDSGSRADNFGDVGEYDEDDPLEASGKFVVGPDVADKPVNIVSLQPMLRRTVGAHYGQVPKIAALALSEQIEAWCLPLGSISRMMRAQSTHSPGHITTVGLGTFVDPDLGGGCINQAARESSLCDLVRHVDIAGQRNLLYRALPINVALIRATTADPAGNLTFEHESLLSDQLVMAMAARNSGGLVIAQVKRIAAAGSLPARSVGVPGVLVDAVVVVSEADQDELHSMSYVTRHSPALTHELRRPTDSLMPLALCDRKVIARRAALALKPGKVVNLGIGMPEGVALVAAEEMILEHVTLTTEPGAIGGLPASGHEFGPSANADALLQMNQQFDFYDGGGLDICFLGAAQITARGDVNVSRLEENRLTGPGGFIDISQSTRSVCFMCTFTAKGLDISFPGNGTLKIEKEGSMKKFVNKTLEITFSGDEAVRRGQKVMFVTERAVFRRSAASDTIELIEIAPGVDLQHDILDQMEFIPVVSPSLRQMDSRLFNEARVEMRASIFGKPLRERCIYHEHEHMMFVDLSGITVSTADDIKWLAGGVERLIKPHFDQRGPINMVVNYEGFDCRAELEPLYQERVKYLQETYYKSVRRYASTAFRRFHLAKQIGMHKWDPVRMFDEFDLDSNGELDAEEIRRGMRVRFGMKLTQKELEMFGTKGVSREKFTDVVLLLLNMCGRRLEPDAGSDLE